MTDAPGTTAGPKATAPSVRAWRRRARRARREHHDRSARDVFTDLYTLLWFVLIYGTALYSEIRRGAWSAATPEDAVERHWLGVAVLLAAAGLAWRGLRAVGPMLATPAEQSWVVSSPLSRRAWLAPRFGAVVACGAVAGVLGVAAVALLGGGSGGAGTAALAGAVFGLALPCASVAAQGARRDRRWPAGVGGVLLATGTLTALAVIAAHYGGRPLPLPSEATGVVLLALGVPLGAGALWSGAGTLPRLDRASLSGGAQLAAAVVTSAVWLDPTVLGGILEVRRWRRVGRVRSRRIRGPVPGLPDRAAALLRAEVVRAGRRPGTLAVVAALALAQYAVAVAAPSLAGVARLILAYVAAGRLMAGLRAVARAPGLRRALGGGEGLVRGAHLALPTLAMLVWWLVTAPAGGGDLGDPAGLLLVGGTVAAAYRAATRGPMTYGGTVIETPFGLLPLELVMKVARGPDLLGVIILLQVLLG